MHHTVSIARHYLGDLRVHVYWHVRTHGPASHACAAVGTKIHSLPSQSRFHNLHVTCMADPTAFAAPLPFCRVRRSNRHVCVRAAATPFSTSPPRRIDIVAVPMTAGGDVLFPGGSQVLRLPLADAIRAKQSPQFGYLPVDAWDEPSTVGTLAVIDEFEPRPLDETALVLCNGLERFRVVSLDEGHVSGTVKCFCDEPTEEQLLPKVRELEKKLVNAMTEIVRLSIKISDESDQQRQKALAETLKRVEAFCGQGGTDESKRLLQHWILELSPDRRREILSFIVMDLLSLSFMSRRKLMLETDTGARLEEALEALDPFIRELAAKGAIVSALGKENLGQASS